MSDAAAPISQATTSAAAAGVAEDPRLTAGRKTVYATGDFTVNTMLTSLSMVFATYFLVQVAGLRAEYAAGVPLIGRIVDAFTDPAMGRLSDRCTWRAGRRRPFFLIGALPFGLFFALLWVTPSTDSQVALFAYYSALYIAVSVAMTVVSVPYLALQPEMAAGYDARTSLNTYRNAGSILGVFAAVAFRPVAELFGGGTGGFASAGAVYGVALALPWLAVYATTWERTDFQARPAKTGLLEGARLVAAHTTFRRLVGLYLCGRVSMDLLGAMLILYFTYHLGRSEDFELMMVVFLSAVLVWLPVWLRLSRSREKASTFSIGCLIWATGSVLILFIQPDWPRWTIFVFAPLLAAGFAVVDLMPWSMLGEVVDEDDLANGERREGIYNGFFMFLRKLAGAAAVFIAMSMLGALGYAQGETQPDAAVWAIRLLASIGTAVFLLLAVSFAWSYPLTRARHDEIVRLLAERDRGSTSR